MDKKRKVISGLKEGDIIDHPTSYYTNLEKRIIIEEFLDTSFSKVKIWKKYTGKERESGQLLRWMRKLGYDTKRNVIFGEKTTIMTSKKVKKRAELISNSEDNDFETLQLKKRIAELEKKLKDADMKAIAYATMVEIAEKEFNIPIRKKYNTKP